MQEDSANDLKMLQEWFETNRIRETGIVENVQKQPASPERDEMLEICKGNIEEFTMMIQLVASIIEREKNQDQYYIDHVIETITMTQEIEIPLDLKRVVLMGAEETKLGDKKGALKQYRKGNLHLSLIHI